MTIRIYKSPRLPSVTIRPRELAAKLGVHLNTIYRWAEDGTLPQPFRLGPRFVGWKREDIEAWLNEQAAEADKS